MNHIDKILQKGSETVKDQHQKEGESLRDKIRSCEPLTKGDLITMVRCRTKPPRKTGWLWWRKYWCPECGQQVGTAYSADMFVDKWWAICECGWFYAEYVPK